MFGIAILLIIVQFMWAAKRFESLEYETKRSDQLTQRLVDHISRLQYRQDQLLMREHERLHRNTRPTQSARKKARKHTREMKAARRGVDRAKGKVEIRHRIQEGMS